MKKSTRNLLLIGGAAVAGYYLYSKYKAAETAFSGSSLGQGIDYLGGGQGLIPDALQNMIPAITIPAIPNLIPSVSPSSMSLSNALMAQTSPGKAPATDIVWYVMQKLAMTPYSMASTTKTNTGTLKTTYSTTAALANSGPNVPFLSNALTSASPVSIADAVTQAAGNIALSAIPNSTGSSAVRVAAGAPAVITSPGGSSVSGMAVKTATGFSWPKVSVSAPYTKKK